MMDIAPDPEGYLIEESDGGYNVRSLVTSLVIGVARTRTEAWWMAVEDSTLVTTSEHVAMPGQEHGA